MENYSYPSYPDSGASSPRSREIDGESRSWEEIPNYKVKFMCSYGGKILPRPHDNQLAYVGGHTKILAFDRNIRFSGIVSKLSSLCDAEVCFKYQLPGEDLDALISVTNDEDLEHMMIEYDRLYQASAKPARLRLFLVPLNTSASFSSDEPKNDREWFVDALNSVPIQSLDASSPPAVEAKETNPDFLFGLEKGLAPPPTGKSQQSIPESEVPEVPSQIPIGLGSGMQNRQFGGEPTVSPIEIQRQIQELQRLQIANQERKSEENLPRAFAGEYYVQKFPEMTAPAPSPVPATVSLPATYWQERNTSSGGYPPPPVAGAATGAEQSVYLFPSPAGMYQPPTLRPGQGYYAMPRMVPDVYRERPVYSVGPPQPSQPPKVTVGPYADSVGMVRPPAPGGVPVPEAGSGYTQVVYDSAGRQVYYTAPGGVMPQYPTVTAASVQAGALNQEGKIAKTS